MNTVIITDSCSDLPLWYVKQRNIPIINYTFNFRGKDYKDDFGQSISYSEFYNDVRNGEMPTTSQVNSQVFIDCFTKYIEKNTSIIYLSFSSALTGTFNNVLLARQILLEKYPNADISIIDTLSASMGQGLLVHYALDLLDQGASKQEIVDWVENNKLKLAHWFTVEDLGHLKRGGRLSSTAAFVGTILNIKPVLHVDNGGRLVPVIKAKGRKKSLKTLIEKMDETIVEPEKQTIFISHGDSIDDANYVAELIRERFPVKDIIINHIGPVIGSHAGPGTIALFFMAR
jgi:DegV family protein with EDD domain